jgi:hypothetical protein
LTKNGRFTARSVAENLLAMITFGSLIAYIARRMGNSPAAAVPLQRIYFPGL